MERVAAASITCSVVGVMIAAMLKTEHTCLCVCGLLMYSREGFLPLLGFPPSSFFFVSYPITNTHFSFERSYIFCSSTPCSHGGGKTPEQETSSKVPALITLSHHLLLSDPHCFFSEGVRDLDVVVACRVYNRKVNSHTHTYLCRLTIVDEIKQPSARTMA